MKNAGPMTDKEERTLFQYLLSLPEREVKALADGDDVDAEVRDLARSLLGAEAFALVLAFLDKE